MDVSSSSALAASLDLALRARPLQPASPLAGWVQHATHTRATLTKSGRILRAAELQEKDPYFNKLVRIMATRCMTQAIYFASGDVARPEYYHYGLAAPLYTHFTSPIRCAALLPARPPVHPPALVPPSPR